MFLMDEINRAEIVPDDACDFRSIVTIGSWITYWTNWDVPRRTVQLVWPEDYTSDLAQISVLSPLGAALIGLHVGDQTPYFVAGRMNVVRIESVAGPESNVVPLVHASVFAHRRPIDDDPGPTAVVERMDARADRHRLIESRRALTVSTDNDGPNLAGSVSVRDFTSIKSIISGDTFRLSKLIAGIR